MGLPNVGKQNINLHPDFTIKISSALVQPDPVVASEDELQQLLAFARQRLPLAYREDGPPLGIFFDPVPAPEPPGSYAAETAGEKRKRVMIDDYEMEGGEGGDLNVTRMVRFLRTQP